MLEQRVRARAQRARDLAGDGEDLAPLLEREVGRDQGAAALARLDDDGDGGEARDDPVPRREAPGRRLDPGRVLRDDEAGRRDPARELGVRRRVVAVDPAAEHGDGDAVRLERAAMGLGVDAAREAADDDETRRGEVATEAPRDCGAVPGARTGADDGDGSAREQLRLGLAAEEEPRRRVVDRSEQRREGRLRAADEADARAGEPLACGPLVEAPEVAGPVSAAWRRDEVRPGLGRVEREGEVAHAASSCGER